MDQQLIDKLFEGDTGYIVSSYKLIAAKPMRTGDVAKFGYVVTRTYLVDLKQPEKNEPDECVEEEEGNERRYKSRIYPVKKRPTNTPNGRKYACMYYTARSTAVARGFVWKLTFDDWITWWLNTGKLEQRGRGYCQYSMRLIDPERGYVLGNLQCVQKNAKSIET